MIGALVIVLGIGGFFGLIIWLAIKQHARTKENLIALAARHGLRLVETKQSLGADYSVQGTVLGREVRFWTYTTGSGKSRVHWAAVGVRPRATNLTFELRRQGFTTKLMEMFGSKEITVGDPAFDQAWFVQTNQPEFLQAALLPEIRAKFMAQPERARDGSYKLADGWVQFAEHGSFATPEVIARLETKLPLLHDLADVAEVGAAGGR
ncbi:hypothetical protein [Oleiharenicola lentus]|uniref:hypothetical protein n=1 Tax=Oleiharenicola lentus TaxID=2508720 RepID=UPI003F679FF0